jgi:hypothetical protein
MNPFRQKKKSGWDRVREDIGSAFQNGGVKAVLGAVGAAVLAVAASAAASSAREESS